jgi:Ca2+-binding RTX toxin-like protein
MATLLGTNNNDPAGNPATTNDSDTVYLLDGNDISKGLGGNDFLYGGQGNDDLQGNDGNDYIEAGDGADDANGNDGDDEVYGGRGNDRLGDDPATGTDEEAGNDYINGGSGDDDVSGGAGDDRLVGSDGNDQIGGGLGRDVMWGGSDKDEFIWTDMAQTGSTGATADWVRDFNRADGDEIVLEQIDANTNKNGDQDFNFIGKKSFSGKAGELRFKNGKLTGDVDGNGAKDFMIKVSGVNKMVDADFDL